MQVPNWTCRCVQRIEQTSPFGMLNPLQKFDGNLHVSKYRKWIKFGYKV